MDSNFDHILLVGFGGPEKAEDVLPFLKRVAAGRNIPEERLITVAHHYEAIGGASPYNQLTFQLVEKMKADLQKAGIDLPVFVGMRNSAPFLKDTLQVIKSKGLTKGIGIILSAFRSEPSCKHYKENVSEAQKENNAEDIHYAYLQPWSQNPHFISAQAEQVRRTLEQMTAEEKEKLLVLFSAHSIPHAINEACAKCDYAEEYKKAAWFVAGACGFTSYELSYQSRSGNPQLPWLGPDVCEVIGENGKDFKAVLTIPIGFWCDNAEVLFDLDIEAKQTADKNGLKYYRAQTVTDHPDFVAMLTKLIGEKIEDREIEMPTCHSEAFFAEESKE